MYFSRSRVHVFSTKLHVPQHATTGACDMTWSQYKNCYSFWLLFFVLFCLFVFVFVVVVVVVVVVVEKMKLATLNFFLFCR